MDDSTHATTLPTERDHPFDPPAGLREALREGRPLTRLAFPDGHLGWLVTRHDIGMRLLGDPRFSARQDLVHVPVRLPITAQSAPPQPGWFVRMDPPEHTKYRRLLSKRFTARRARELTGRIEEIVDERLDALEDHGPPADLVAEYAMPIPSMVICELVGVPPAQRGEFQHHSAMLTKLDADPDQVMAANEAFGAFVYGLVQEKRADPGDDLLSYLAESGELTDEELVTLGVLILMTGHETTAQMIAHGVYALLSHPDQLAALRADPELIGPAVEELLRYLSVVQAGISRAALEDVEIDGQVVAAGETVTVWISTANRDPAAFANPDAMDITRGTTGHVAFGQGIHQCLGQHFARAEMRIAYTALFRRFPDLRLAVPADGIPLRTDMSVYGVKRLPVAW